MIKKLLNLFYINSFFFKFFKSIIDELSNRSLNRINAAHLVTNCEKLPKNKEKLIFYKAHDIHEIKKNSPFVSYFDKTLKKLEEELKAQAEFRNKNKLILEPNHFYAPILFGLIKKRLFIMSMWSCVMVGDWQSYSKRTLPRTRQTTNPVENHFDHYKNHMFKGEKKTCSQFMLQTYERIEATHIKYFTKPTVNDHIQPNIDLSGQSSLTAQKSAGSSNPTAQTSAGPSNLTAQTFTAPSILTAQSTLNSAPSIAGPSSIQDKSTKETKESWNKSGKRKKKRKKGKFEVLKSY